MWTDAINTCDPQALTRLLSQPAAIEVVDAAGRGLVDALCRAITSTGSIPLVRSEVVLAAPFGHLPSMAATATDARWSGTPLDWARGCGQPEAQAWLASLG